MALSNADLIVQIRAEHKQLTKTLNSAKREVRSASNSISKQAGMIGTSLAAAFGGQQILSGLQSGIMKIADFEFQMDKVAAVSGATGEDLKRLSENALDLGARSQFTASQIGGLQEELARLGFGTEQIINMTDASRKLAQVADAELGEAAKVLGKQLNAFNLSSAESAEVANIMAESFSKSALDLEQFSVAMSFAGAAGKAFGLDIAQVTSMVGVLIDNGIQASKAGSGLRDIFADLTTKGLSLEEALQKVNTSEDGFATALDLVGKTSANQLLILAQNQERVKSLGDELSDTNKELNTMVHIMEDNLTTDLKLLESAFDGLIMEGGALNDMFRGTVQMLTGLVNKIQEYSDEIGTVLRVQYGIISLGLSEVFLDQAESVAKLKKEAEGVFTGPMPAGEVKPFGFDLPEFKQKVDNVTDSVKKLKDEIQKVIITPDFSGPITRDDLREGLNLDSNYFSPDPEEIAEDAWGEMVAAQQAEEFKKVRDQLQSEADSLNAIANETLASGVAALAEGLATGDITNGFKMLFDVIGEGLQSLGKAMLSLGFAKLALTKFAALGPGALIAAGSAAIAAGALIKKSSASISSAGSGNFSSSGGSGTSLQGQTLTIKGESRISGADIVFIYDQQQRLEGRTSG